MSSGQGATEEQSERPILYIVAGPNGAGKSTFTRSGAFKVPVLDFDKLVNSMRHTGKSWIEVGRIQKSIFDGFLVQKTSFVLETTLSGRSIFANIRSAATSGFQIQLHFVGLDSLALAKARVAGRVKLGGHDIPTEIQARRFPRCFKNIFEIARISDQVFLYDNAVEYGIVLLATWSAGEITQNTSQMPEWTKKVLQELKSGF